MSHKQNGYSDLSCSLTKQLSKTEKKDMGIFFTPPMCVLSILQKIKCYIDIGDNNQDKDKMRILEPSCGSGEFIEALSKTYTNAEITGIELNKQIFDSIQEPFSNKTTALYNMDFLDYREDQSNNENGFDLIIGNPPFAVLKKKDVNKKYYPYFDGRPNIFVLFILKSIELLKNDGVLCFVLPKNFLNCIYYDKTRKYITEQCDIIDIYECSGKYLETQQETITIVIKKRTTTLCTNVQDKYVFNISGYTIFTTGNSNEIRSLYQSSSTLENMGFKVSVGTVVWNQCKNILTNDTSKTLLIYNSDFSKGNLNPKSYKNNDKKNYIQKDGVKNPVIALNRGYGKGAYTFDYCIIDLEKPYLLENHVICVEYTGNDKTRNEIIDMYTQLIQSFNNEKTKKFIALYFGNNAINTTELNSILPIYL